MRIIPKVQVMSPHSVEEGAVVELAFSGEDVDRAVHEEVLLGVHEQECAFLGRVVMDYLLE